MEKIIYNTKIKKFLAIFLVTIIVMNTVMPSIVWADDEAVTKTFKEWQDSAVNEDDKTIMFDNVRNYLHERPDFMEYNELTGERMEYIKSILNNSPETIKIRAIYKPDKGWFSSTEFTVLGWAFIDNNGQAKQQIEKTYNELIEYLGLSTEEEIKKLDNKIISKIQSEFFDENETLPEGYDPLEISTVILEKNKDIIKLKVQERGDDYDIISFEVPGKDEYQLEKEAGENLGLDSEPDSVIAALADGVGGFLLAPIFWLVNFVADAVIETVGEWMTGDGYVNLGFGVLGNKTREHEVLDGEEIDYPVEIESFFLGAYKYPNLTYTPEEIFAGKIDLLSIDFITGKVARRDSNGNIIRDSNGNVEYKDNSDTGWRDIRKVIASWYKVLRMIAIIGLLSVLIYMGIKIILSANAKEKAKYKQWIIDWFMAVAILFSMHFIMAFVVSVTGEFSNLLGESCGKINVEVVENGVSTGDKFVTNLMGIVRFMIQSESAVVQVAYEIMYVMLIVYTIKFTLVYLKRVLNMAFLTLIAPIVALMYPLDKINDGNAQSFGMWLKEYIYNALLQPMHLILYYVLLGSAVGVAAANPIYGIVVLTFLSEAEKLLKKIFGFDKAGGGTVGGMAGAFAAGAIASNIKNIAKFGGIGGKSGDGSGGDRDEILNNPKPVIGSGVGNFGIADNQLPTGSSSGNVNSQGGAQASGGQNAKPSNTKSSNTNSSNTKPSNTKPLNTNSSNTKPSNAKPSNTNPNSKSQDKGTPIRKMARGLGAVGKKLIKPVYNTDKSFKYNAKRWGRRLVGAGVGVTAAAIQAGISLTDGKYNPMEGIATFTAGYAGGKQLTKGLGNVIDTYRDGADEGDKIAQMKRAKDRFRDRDDVIEFNKKNFAGREKEAMERQREQYLTRGVTDLKEMKSGMKYADTLIAKGISKEAADKRAADTINFRNQLKDQNQLGVVYDDKKREKYIEEVSGGDESIKAKYRNAFNSLIAYNDANA